MNDIQLSTGEVAEIAGVPAATVANWVDAGLIGPAKANGGKGRHRSFTLIETLAVAAGATWRSEEAKPVRVAQIIRFIAGLGLQRFERELKAGRTLPVIADQVGPFYPPMMIVPPSMHDMPLGAALLMRRIDMGFIYKRVMKKIAELKRRPKNVRGRNRGLVAAT